MSAERAMRWGDVASNGATHNTPYTWGMLNGMMYEQWLRREMASGKNKYRWNINMTAKSDKERLKLARAGKSPMCTRHFIECYSSAADRADSGYGSIFDCQKCWEEQEAYFYERRDYWIDNCVTERQTEMVMCYGVEVFPATRNIMLGAIVLMREDQVSSASVIARRMHMSKEQVYNALKALRKAGLVKALNVKGIHGGWKLTERGMHAIAS